MSILERVRSAWTDYDRRVAHFIGTAYLGEGKQRAGSERASQIMVNTSPLYGMKIRHPFGTYFNAGDYA